MCGGCKAGGCRADAPNSVSANLRAMSGKGDKPHSWSPGDAQQWAHANPPPRQPSPGLLGDAPSPPLPMPAAQRTLLAAGRQGLPPRAVPVPFPAPPAAASSGAASPLGALGAGRLERAWTVWGDESSARVRPPPNHLCWPSTLGLFAPVQLPTPPKTNLSHFTLPATRIRGDDKVNRRCPRALFEPPHRAVSVCPVLTSWADQALPRPEKEGATPGSRLEVAS